MAYSDIYKNQVRLLVRTLPYVAQEECFALKGGTAINLFIRSMPRLSVDIDLTYLPDADRQTALTEIENALRRIAARIKIAIPEVHITESAPQTQETINKLVIRTKERVQIKIEVTPVLRGSVFKPTITQVTSKVEEEFGFAQIKVLPFPDLYAGKIMAALDRQHPRDLYDVKLLLENEGIDTDLRKAIIIYLISHDRPPQTLLNPRLKDISQEFESAFIGMTEEPVEVDALLLVRKTLINEIVAGMPEAHKEFLISFYQREPKWELLGLAEVESLPAIRWREYNLDKATPEAKKNIVDELTAILS